MIKTVSLHNSNSNINVFWSIMWFLWDDQKMRQFTNLFFYYDAIYDRAPYPATNIQTLMNKFDFFSILSKSITVWR